MPFDKSIKVLQEACRIGKSVIFTLPMAGGEEDKNKNPEHQWMGSQYTITILTKDKLVIAKFESKDFVFIKMK